jgi:hypothetical protein
VHSAVGIVLDPKQTHRHYCEVTAELIFRNEGLQSTPAAYVFVSFGVIHCPALLFGWDVEGLVSAQTRPFFLLLPALLLCRLTSRIPSIARCFLLGSYSCLLFGF